MQETRRKPEGFITGDLGYLTFSKVFVSSEDASKTPITSETEVFVK